MAAAFATSRFETGETSGRAVPIPDAFELGSLIAALAEQTEDEFELDLLVRAHVEAGSVHLVQRVVAWTADPRRTGSPLEN